MMESKQDRLAALRGTLREAGAVDAPEGGARRTETRDWLRRLNGTLAELESICCRIMICCSRVVSRRETASRECDGGARAGC